MPREKRIQSNKAIQTTLGRAYNSIWHRENFPSRRAGEYCLFPFRLAEASRELFLFKVNRGENPHLISFIHCAVAQDGAG